MVISIIGNIASGKTTLATRIHNYYFLQYQYLAIDDFRIKYNPDNTVGGEQTAVSKFVAQVNKLITEGENLIIENTGAGKFYNDIQLPEDTITILLDIDPVIAHVRHIDRTRDPNYTKIPFAYSRSLHRSIMIIYYYLTIKKIILKIDTTTQDQDQVFNIAKDYIDKCQ